MYAVIFFHFCKAVSHKKQLSGTSSTFTTSTRACLVQAPCSLFCFVIGRMSVPRCVDRSSYAFEDSQPPSCSITCIYLCGIGKSGSRVRESDLFTALSQFLMNNMTKRAALRYLRRHFQILRSNTTTCLCLSFIITAHIVLGIHDCIQLPEESKPAP